jgi:hypothetical protein
MPKEQFHFYKIYPRTVKTDNYAVGKTLAELWHANPLVNKTKPVVGLSEQITFFRYAKKNTEYDYTNFFSNGLSSEHVEQLKNMLENLTRAIPDERWSIQQAVASLRSIQAERNIGIRHQLSSKTARI